MSVEILLRDTSPGVPLLDFEGWLSGTVDQSIYSLGGPLVSRVGVSSEVYWRRVDCILTLVYSQGLCPDRSVQRDLRTGFLWYSLYHLLITTKLDDFKLHWTIRRYLLITSQHNPLVVQGKIKVVRSENPKESEK